MVAAPPRYAVEVDGLGFDYGRESIIDNLSLAVSPGESIAVLGKSGSGKSTLLSCILGLIPPSRGSIHVDGELVTRGSGRALARLRRRKIGMVFQGGELLPELSPVENVIMAGLLGGLGIEAAQERAAHLLARLGVPPGERSVKEFSGGEQQRVAVARALVNKPPLLLADEPTGSLDSETRDDVVGLLRSLPAEFGCAMIIVTHDPVAAEGCTRQARLENGRLTDMAPAGTKER